MTAVRRSSAWRRACAARVRIWRIIPQAAVTYFVLGTGSGVLPLGLCMAEALADLPARQAPPLHTSAAGVPDDFIFALNYTWFGPAEAPDS
jgi:hypothetical protein